MEGELKLPHLKDRFNTIIKQGDTVRLLVGKGGNRKNCIFKVVFSIQQHRWGLQYINNTTNHEYEEVRECTFYLTPNLASDLKVEFSKW